MTRRKQSKPRALLKVDGPSEKEEPAKETASMNDNNEKISNNLIKKEPEHELSYATNEEALNDELISDGENSFDSFSSELYSSQTSSSFPASDGTVNSYIDGGKSSIRKDKTSNSLDDKSNKKGKTSSSCSYQCQFCDKSFPRLGYLKKHEQSHEEHMPFKCDYCARLFKHKRSRDRHTKLHTGDRRYKCLHCESAFSRSDHLKIHMKTHDNQKPFQCTVCNRGYNTAAALTSHMQNHKKLAIRDGSGNGSLYNYSPRSTSSLSSSNSVIKRKRYESRIQRSELQATQSKCGLCTKSDFQSIDELNTHIKTIHNNDITATEQHNHFRQQQQEHQAFYENLQIVSCEFCTMKFETIKKMFHHIKQTHGDRLKNPSKDHIETYLCDSSKAKRYENELIDSKRKNEQTQNECNNDKIKIELNNNDDGDEDDDDESMAVENEKPTDLSQPKPKNEENLIPRSNHMNTVINNTDIPSAFMCNQCEASLPDFESFRLHLKSHLDQYNNKIKGHDTINGSFAAAPVSNLICLQCGLTLENQTDFEYHTEQHFIITNAEYICEPCKKCFPKLEDLQKHLNDVHINYKCLICQESFETKIAINLHFSLKHVHEIKIYRCSVCSEVFQLEKEFKHHIRTIHLTHNTIQCIFCRVVCASEIEMHFHLATHVKQFRCPACAESFHVEFLLDRHLQLHHAHKELITTEPKLQQTVHTNKFNENSYNQLIKSSNFYNYQITNKFYNTPLKADTLRPISFNAPRSTSTIHSNNQNSFDSFKLSPNLYLSHAEQTTKSIDSDKNNFLYGHHVTNLLAKVRNDENGSSSNSLLKSTDGLNLHLEKRYHQAMIRNIYEKSLQKTNKNVNDDVDNIQNQMEIISNLQNPQKKQPIEHNNTRINLGEIDCRKAINTHNSKSGVSLKCAYCSGDFRSRTELENHMKIQHNIGGKHKCLICDEILPSPAVLAEHKLSHCKVGSPGKCSHCMKSLSDANVFKQHLNEHNSGNGISKHKTSPYELPVECIVCRQVLSSEFEITLHAKFHTKSFDINEEQRTCALCLESLPGSNIKKICDSCFKKHNFSAPGLLLPTSFSTNQLNESTFVSTENKITSCNLCKNILPNAQKLQEHLIEHTFRGTNSYICYICSSIFTSAMGLQQHIQEHEKDSGSKIKPYECNFCNHKYFFRTELEHHQLDHELKLDAGISHEKPSQSVIVEPEVVIETKSISRNHENLTEKKEDDDEYIEVEKVSS